MANFLPLRKGHNVAGFKMVPISVDVQGVIQWHVFLILVSVAPILSEKTNMP